ncbi:hypothetical protein C1H46_028380 [Malus baccata]|uniref:Uncharacterized protein n=1 Tax=Malus baccata TaxID=106549 RepID=A0A540LIA1_MALBA|nr:hypothetical protein C1H46_028380 [Malus baccata]
MFGLSLEKDEGILDQFVKVNELELIVEMQCKELEAKRPKLKKLVRESSKEIAACLQLATHQLHVDIPVVLPKGNPLCPVFCHS